MSAFSANLRRLRQEAGLSHALLAAKLRLPVGTVSSWETGEVALPRTPLEPVAAIFGVTPAQLLQAPPGLGGACDVWRIACQRPCGESPASPFAARCACDHDMAGLACNACLGSAKPGCLTCWEDKRHRCTVSFLAAELAVVQ